MSETAPGRRPAGRFEPLSPSRLADRLAAELIGRHRGHQPHRVALDVPLGADFEPVLAELIDRLRAAGRPVAIVRADGFYRDASLRFEYGKTDVESFYSGWLDAGALQREVLLPLASDGRYLPALRDPDSNRSVRAEPCQLAATGFALVVGQLLLSGGLSFDTTIHLMVSRQARRRRTPADWQWALPAFDRYDVDLDPAGLADLVIRFDDPGHPALRQLPGRVS